MGRHNVKCKRAYGKKRRQAKKEKKKQLKLLKLSGASETLSESVSKITDTELNCMPCTVLERKEKSNCSKVSSKLPSEKDKVLPPSSCSSTSDEVNETAFSVKSRLSTTDIFIDNLKSFKSQKHDKKFMEFERDPLFVKWQEYKLLQKRVKQLDGSYSASFLNRCKF